MVKVASIKKFTKDLTPRQRKTMNRHARHHSLKHMRSMANRIVYMAKCPLDAKKRRRR